MPSDRHEIAVVAGATGSMGAAITKRLADCGLEVVAVGRTESALRKLATDISGVRPLVADLTSDSAVTAIGAALDKPVRAIVNAVSLPQGTLGSLLDVPTAAVVEAFNVKVAGMIRLVRAVDAHLQRHSRLICIGGHFGLEPSARDANPGAANAALVNVMKQYSLIYGSRGISAHLVVPAATDTDRLRRVITARAKARVLSEDHIRAEIIEESAIKLIATVGHIAWAISILLAPEADVMTGTILSVDAGRRHGLP
jgi:NAD(P)-dependent dehydrogenase (short-subunit alcohol dehydrogenase family)